MKLTALNAWAIMLQLSGALRQTVHSRSTLQKVLLPLSKRSVRTQVLSCRLATHRVRECGDILHNIKYLVEKRCISDGEEQNGRSRDPGIPEEADFAAQCEEVVVK